MDLNKDFIAVQGIFLSLEKNLGELKRIKYRGGNEVAILNIITELQKFFSSKNYIIKGNVINDAFNEDLNNIVLFLILNTELKSPVNEPDYSHLINIMPQLSTCVLANIIIGLDLSKHYCKTLEKLPLNLAAELLEEMVPCLKKCKPNVHLKNAYTFLQLIITKLSVSTEKAFESNEKITDYASIMLLNLTGLHGDQYKTVNVDLVYEHMGHCIWNLLDLLLQCDIKNTILTTIIEKLIKTCCSIMMAVTIDVFCSWAETETNGQNFQTSIAEKSYLFIEKYQKYPTAKELIGMLGTIAQKPKTIDELIYQADVPTMISMINKADSNQKAWFTALLNTQVLKCKDSINCIGRWSHLCTSEDVSRLLNMSVHNKNSEAKALVVKCAAALESEQLILVATRYFYENGINTNLNDDIQQQMVLLFNKIKDKNVQDEFAKEIHLLLLQNPEQLLSYLFSECLKNTFFTYNLKSLFPSLKEIADVNNIGLKVLNTEIMNNKPNDQNCKNYIELFNTFLEIKFYPIEVIMDIILIILQNGYTERNYELIKCITEILKSLNENPPLKQESEVFFNLLFDIMKNCRCKFLEFDRLKQEIVKDIVDVINKLCEVNCNSPALGNLGEVCEEDIFVSFYKTKLFRRDFNINLSKHFFPHDLQNHAEMVAHLIKILPLCVTQEWLIISTNLVDHRGIESTMECLSDCIILLCHLLKSQETKTEEVNKMLNGLKYCLHNYGIVIKECIQPRLKNLDEDVIVTKKVCHVLTDIPPGNLKSEEGLSLANLLSDESLSSLKADKRFACLVASIKESHICQMLAQKILK